MLRAFLLHELPHLYWCSCLVHIFFLNFMLSVFMNFTSSSHLFSKFIFDLHGFHAVITPNFLELLNQTNCFIIL